MPDSKPDPKKLISDASVNFGVSQKRKKYHLPKGEWGGFMVVGAYKQQIFTLDGKNSIPTCSATGTWDHNLNYPSLNCMRKKSTVTV
jgi:hypothetical protein